MGTHAGQWDISVQKKGIQGSRFVFLRATNKTGGVLAGVDFEAKIKAGNTIISRYFGRVGQLDAGETEEIVLNNATTGALADWLTSLDGVVVYLGTDKFRFGVNAMGVKEL